MANVWVETTRADSFDEAQLLAIKTVKLVQWLLDESHPVIKRETVKRFAELQPEEEPIKADDMDAEADTFTRITIAVPIINAIESEFRECFAAVVREVALIKRKEFPEDNRWSVLVHLIGGIVSEAEERKFSEYMQYLLVLTKQFGFKTSDTVATAMQVALMVLDKFLDNSSVLVVGRNYKNNRYEDGDRRMLSMREFMAKFDADKEDASQ